ncbi:tyrosine-type recombinase/integrase [Sporosarcina sp. 179-K 8C2 HS]|uniref:tyrosine-type recombinase/integrase n=1 Tax=Sporosarcina sp. 179-K 8C2 HS TaxID=3142387 RepID=UPI00399FAC87
MYKAAFKLNQEGKNVLMPTLIAMYTGLRNSSLCKLLVKSVTAEGRLEFSHKAADTNSKNKDFILPLPPKLFAMLQKYIKDCNLDSNEQLLYGMRGKPLENKQFNAITRNLCISLGWITVRDCKPGEVAADKNSVIEGRKLYTNTEKYFTPHGFRYSISTIFSEMGVMHDSIKYLLNHSDFEKGNLKSYILSDQKYIKEIQTGQLIIETLFETALNLERKNNITLDIERIEHDLPNVFAFVKRDENEIHQFQNYIINFAFTQAQQQLANTRMIEKNIPFEQFGYPQPQLMEYQTPYQVNPYQQQQSYGYRQERPAYSYGSHYPSFYNPLK